MLKIMEKYLTGRNSVDSRLILGHISFGHVRQHCPIKMFRLLTFLRFLLSELFFFAAYSKAEL